MSDMARKMHGFAPDMRIPLVPNGHAYEHNVDHELAFSRAIFGPYLSEVCGFLIPDLAGVVIEYMGHGTVFCREKGTAGLSRWELCESSFFCKNFYCKLLHPLEHEERMKLLDECSTYLALSEHWIGRDYFSRLSGHSMSIYHSAKMLEVCLRLQILSSQRVKPELFSAFRMGKSSPQTLWSPLSIKVGKLLEHCMCARPKSACCGIHYGTCEQGARVHEILRALVAGCPETWVSIPWQLENLLYWLVVLRMTNAEPCMWMWVLQHAMCEFCDDVGASECQSCGFTHPGQYGCEVVPHVFSCVSYTWNDR